MSSFTIREAAICDSAARLGSGISQTRVERSWEDNCVVDLSTKAKAKPLILKKRPQPTPPTCPSNQPNSSNARGDGGASSEPSEEKKGTLIAQNSLLKYNIDYSFGGFTFSFMAGYAKNISDGRLMGSVTIGRFTN
jgi:hypothetical protein